MKMEMRMMRRAERREEWRAQMERERLDLERERFERELQLTPETCRTVRDEFQTHIAMLLSSLPASQACSLHKMTFVTVQSLLS